MPDAWTSKDERQYEEIKRSALDRGRSEERAEAIAARTVNKQRRREGRTPNTTTMGMGNPTTSLNDRTVDELRTIASEMKIKGRSKMKKQQLVSEIRARQWRAIR